mgnify:CR=1 FL=1
MQTICPMRFTDLTGIRTGCLENEGARHCLLVTGEGMEDGVLVESVGASYARYFAFVPSVSGILEQEQAVKETQTLSMIKESGQEEQAGMVLS